MPEGKLLTWNNARVLRHDADGLWTLTLDRPEKLNALDTQTFEELEAHLADLEESEGTVGCLVLRGAGRAFCAGADLEAIGTPASRPPSFEQGVIERLGVLSLPVLAMSQRLPRRIGTSAAKRIMIETDGMSLAEGLAHEHYRYPGLAPIIGSASRDSVAPSGASVARPDPRST